MTYAAEAVAPSDEGGLEGDVVAPAGAVAAESGESEEAVAPAMDDGEEVEPPVRGDTPSPNVERANRAVVVGEAKASEPPPTEEFTASAAAEAEAPPATAEADEASDGGEGGFSCLLDGCDC